jgi:hypothetical protein
VLNSVVAHLALYSNGMSEVRKLGEEAVDWRTTTDDFDDWDQQAGGSDPTTEWHDPVQ